MNLEIFIATLALLISVIHLWKTYFFKSKPFFRVGGLREHIYPIKSGDEEWYICSFDIPISISNHGAKLLIIENIRLKLIYRDVDLIDNYEYLYTKWSIDPKDSNKIDIDRFKWIESIELLDWIPQLIQSRSVTSRSFIFETRLDFPIDQKIDIILQVKMLHSKSWMDIKDWNIEHDLALWEMLIFSGSSMTYNSIPKFRERSEVLSNEIYIKEKIKFDMKSSALQSSYLNHHNKKIKILNILNILKKN